jgi:hypothetical protein
MARGLQRRALERRQPVPTIKSLTDLTRGAAFVAVVVEAARIGRESVPAVLLVVGTIVALLLARRTGGGGQ